MKLGDSMAPIEACNVWNDVCPRKTRPPKIGDIPRHVAVDEESPGSSSARVLARINEVPRIAEKPTLERSSVRYRSEHAKKHPVGSPALPHLETSPNSSDSPPRAIDGVSSSSYKTSFPRKDSPDLSSRSSASIPPDVPLNGPSPMYDEIRETSGPERPLEVSKKRPCVEVFGSISETDRKLYEEAVAEGIFEVRKDSALYIDERTLESLVSEGPAPVANSRLVGPKTRRESSGYFSNLGTFDEDRWTSSPMDQSNLQDSTRESLLRERRRSSTKNNRLPTGNHQQPQPAHVASGQQVNRPSLGCPKSDETNLSLSESDAPANPIARSGRIEMPNIDEQPSLETNKCCGGEEADEVLVIETEFANKLSIRSSPVRNEVSSDSTIDEENRFGNSKNGEAEETIGKCSNDSPTHWSSPRAGTANRQRRRVVVHQYSSPNITNTELERIVEKPYGEIWPSASGNSKPEVSSSNAERLGETDDEEEDDDDQVVVARHDREKSDDRRDNADGEDGKLLPRSVKVYQLLSTQSEDRGDGDARLFDRRISLQIPRNNEEEVNDCPPLPKICSALGNEYPEEKKLVHADSVPIIKIPSLVTSTVEGELRLCAGERTPGSDIPTGPAIAGIRPIYPYCPYSPYASPQGSPRTNRRRPLRESRRVSIDSRQGALQLNQYKLLNNIGQGSYGIVKLAYNEEDETHYAMKILSKKKLMKKAGIFGRIAPGRKGVTNPLAKVYREIALLKKLDHPNVVKLVEVLDDPDEDNLYLVFELVQKGEVMQLPTDKPLDEETARRHFRDVVMGVEYLHYQRIVHRDIKPSNLLVDSDGRVKVADLGVSAELRASGELLSGSAGTPAFAAPETTTPGAQYSGTLCDVWSMGVTLYSLVTGKVPWDGAGSIIGVQAAVRSEPLRFPEKPQLSDSLRDLISRMLAKDPARRMNLAEIKEHHWLTNNGEEPLPNEADNCRLPVTVTDEEVARVVTRVPKLDTLILIKTMLKQHSFQNPFLPRRIVRPGCTSGEPVVSSLYLKQQASTDITDPSTKSSLPAGETLKSKTQQFHKAGRSNSAPDSYEWQTNGRQISNDPMLPPVTESSSQEAEVENR